MPRRPRDKSPSGIHHIMVRGIGKMNIFPTRSDKEAYLQIVSGVRRTKHFDLIAYCIMDNHAHLLVREQEEQMSAVMKSIGIRFSQYFNKKNQRVGHVFQDRYKSEVIKSARQCLVCTRYIHNNPVKAGIASSPCQYPWSSYNAYFNNQDHLVHTELVLAEFAPSRNQAQIALKKFTAASGWQDDDFLDYPEDDNKDSGKQNLVEKIVVENGYSTDSFPQLKYHVKKEIIRLIISEIDISQRELASILKVSRSIVQRAMKQD